MSYADPQNIYGSSHSWLDPSHNAASSRLSSHNSFSSNTAHVPAIQMDVEPLADATLRQVEEVANEDVEMQPAPSQHLTYFVVDTNIVLHQLDVLQQFVSDAEVLGLPIILIIPGIVISELDQQKNRPGLAWSARRASTWLLEKVKERRSVKGQAHEETCKHSGKWNVRDRGEVGGPEANDDLIMDCCQFFLNRCRSSGLGRVVLCSADKNLCIKSESKDIPSISPSHTWSSREIARALFGSYAIDLGLFDSYSSKTSRQFAKDSNKQAHVLALPAEDMMDIDDAVDGGPLYQTAPSHPLDALHLEVIDHFSRLFVELVDRVGGADVPRARGNDSALARSAHAPSWARVALPDWTLADCVGYLASKKQVPMSRPSLEVFLLKPYCKQRGWRRGQDWSKRDWDVCQDALERIGEAWGDRAIQESMTVLRPYAEGIFTGRMRPTGI